MFKFVVIFSGILFTILICDTKSQLLTSNKQDPRIVGGFAANISDYSYIVSIRHYNFWTRQFTHWCGGSIYNETVIITAAHCLYRRPPLLFSIRAGSQNHNTGGQLIYADKFIIHENYNRATLKNDIGLIILKTPLTFNDNVSSINLPNINTKVPDGTTAFVTGWGVTKEGNRNPPDNLQAVEVEIINKIQCEKYYGQIDDEMLCAGKQKGGKDSCQGDSGGPLVTNKTLIGIVSWGYGCARENYPGVYTNLLKLFNWVIKTLT